MTNYAKGADRERQVIEVLQGEGAVAIRAAGSRGPVDVVALRAGRPPLLVQVKSGKKPYQGFNARDRRRLLELAKRAGGIAVLCHWPPRDQPKFIPPEEWPDSEAA